MIWIARTLVALALSAGLQAPPPPGFSITFDGGVFKDRIVE